MPAPLTDKNLAAVSRLPKGKTAHRLFFFREELPPGAHNVHHAYAPVEKVPVTFDGWDEKQGSLASFASSIVALEDGYRLYATVRSRDRERCGIRAWDSSDGLHWEPTSMAPEAADGVINRVPISGLPEGSDFIAQPQIVPLRDGRWRMYFWKHGGGHLRYTVAESEDGLRWSVPDFERPVLYHPSEGGLWRWAQGLAPHTDMDEITLSKDEILEHKRLASNDATYVYYNDALDRYECYSVWLHPAIPERRVDVDNAPGVHRTLHRRHSEDGLHWSDPEMIMIPDQRDPWDLQFYYLAVQWHLDWLIGSVGHYRVEAGQQTQDQSLCFSRDGKGWERPLRGGFIPRPPRESGATDSMGIYGPNTWIDLGDRWLILYTGTPDAHNEGGKRSQTMGATCAKNRFVGLAADAVRGGFMTEPFVATRPQIMLDADIDGWLRAELCDGFGRKMDDHHLMDAVPIQGNEEHHVLRWKDQPTDLHRYECVRLRFEFCEGTVYGVDF
ncbi:MAG: sialidase family protein [Anaerolineae bacterium]